MLNINLLVLPLHWKFTSTPAQLGRGNTPWKQPENTVLWLYFYNCPFSGRFLVLTQDPKVPASWVLCSLPESCVASKSPIRSILASVSAPCSCCRVQPWQGALLASQHTRNSPTAWQRPTHGEGASIKHMDGVLIKPGRSEVCGCMTLSCSNPELWTRISP